MISRVHFTTQRMSINPLKFSQKAEGEDILPNSFCEASNFSVPTADKESTSQIYELVSFEYMTQKSLTKY